MTARCRDRAEPLTSLEMRDQSPPVLSTGRAEKLAESPAIKSMSASGSRTRATRLGMTSESSTQATVPGAPAARITVRSRVRHYAGAVASGCAVIGHAAHLAAAVPLRRTIVLAWVARAVPESCASSGQVGIAITT